MMNLKRTFFNTSALLLGGLLFTASLLAVSLPATATEQSTTSKQSSLHDELAAKDAEFFQRGFNQCDFAYLEATISPTLKFYHDQGGFQDKALFMKNTKQFLCGDPAHKPIRKLIAGSLSVFPLYQNGTMYGAIQQGRHQFYLREAGKPDQLTGTARFTSVWLKQGQDWLLGDVLSYDHQPAEAEPQASVLQSDASVLAAQSTAKLTSTSASTPASARKPKATPQAASQVPALAIETLLKQQHVPALGLGIIKNGVLESVQVYGELSPGQAAPQNTLFKVASLTKPIVTLLTLRLVAEGKLTLDEPLAAHWVDPDLQADPRHLLLTPRLVLTHQTGFANWRYLEQDKKLRFQFQPGSKHQYSGEGFEYLRRALEHKFGQPLEALAQQYVFAPAGMTDTHFWWTPEVDESRYAGNYDVKGELLPLEKYFEANAAANLITTVSDYSKFLLFVLAQQQAMPQLYLAMVQPQVSLRPHHAFGLGFEMFSDFSNGESALLHTGRDPGVSTAAVFFPASRNGYVIFMNGDNAMPVLEQLLPQLYLGAELWQKR